MSWFVVILRDSLTDLDRRRPHHRIEIGVIVGFPAKHLDTQGSFLERLRVTYQRSLDHEPEQGRIALAVLK